MKQILNRHFPEQNFAHRNVKFFIAGEAIKVATKATKTTLSFVNVIRYFPP